MPTSPSSGGPKVILRALGDEAWIDTDTGKFQVTVEATIDGVPITDLMENYRVLSPGGFFGYEAPAGAIFDIAEGSYAHSVSDGWWLLIDPLPAGEHVITFRGDLFSIVEGETEIIFFTAVTYNITVSP